MKMGNPLDETTDMGTVVSKAQLERIQKYIEIGSKEPGLLDSNTLLSVIRC